MSREKLLNDPDFIYAEEHGNSLKRAMKANEHGVSDSKIMVYLKLSKEELDSEVNKIKVIFEELL